jgi:hypothetical protein
MFSQYKFVLTEITLVYNSSSHQEQNRTNRPVFLVSLDTWNLKNQFGDNNV